LTGTFTWLLPAAFPGPHPAGVQQHQASVLQQQGRAWVLLQGTGFQAWALNPHLLPLHEIVLLFLSTSLSSVYEAECSPLVIRLDPTNPCLGALEQI
jgi:hypothetical protein